MRHPTPVSARREPAQAILAIALSLIVIVLGTGMTGCASTSSSRVKDAGHGPSGASLRPRPVQDGWLFAFRAPAGSKSVSLAGEFNGWSTSAWPMSDADGDGVWSITVPLETGRSYQYKFVVNGGEWMTDPWAEATDPNNYNNGIVFTRRPGEACLSSFLPADGARLTSLTGLSALVDPQGHAVTDARVELSDFVGRQRWPLQARWNPATREVTAAPPVDLADGDYLVTLTVELQDAPALTRTINFTLDRWTGRVDAPAAYDRAVMYEIFVRSFADGLNDDGTGDLPGLTSRLDYLNDGDPRTADDLDVDVLWLMPVHPSPSYHGYDITDYEAIEEDYGNLEDYRTFVTGAHRRGMKVMLDYVVNHSSNEHPFFRDALRNPASRYSSWYKFTDSGNEHFTGFAGIGAMPEFNFRSPEMRSYLLEMARFWIDPDGDGDRIDGVDGLRCDVAKGPPHDFWRELRHETKAIRPDFSLLAEVWDSAPTITSYFHDQFDMNFDYPLYYATLDLLGGRSEPLRFLREYQQIRDTYPPGAQLVRFLDNHDNNRIASILGGDIRRQKMATGILFALPGTPLVYYGMEVGMLGSKPDPDIRKPMRWDEVARQTSDPASLLSWHRRLIRLRHETPALTARDDAATRSLQPGRSDASGVLAFLRRSPEGGPAVLAVANVTGQPLQATVTIDGATVRQAMAAERIGSGVRLAGADGPVDLVKGWMLDFEPYGFAMYELAEVRGR